MIAKKYTSLFGALVLTTAAMPSHADVFGMIGLTSSYVFRGLERSDGAAIQGRVEYAHDSGAYAGVWASNTDNIRGAGVPSGTQPNQAGSEVNIYAGYAKTIQTGIVPVKIDAGAITYWYESEGTHVSNPQTTEVFVGASAGPVSAKLYYTGSLFRSGEAGYYVTASYEHKLKPDVSLTAQLGRTMSDAYADDFWDYSVSLTKELRNDVNVTMSLSETDREGGDDTKFVVSAVKNFEF